MRIGARHAIDWAADAANAVPAVLAIDVLANEVNQAALEAWSADRPSRAPLRVMGNGISCAGKRRGAVADLARYLATTGLDEDLLLLAADNLFDFDLAPLATGARTAPTVLAYDVGTPQKVQRYASLTLAPDGKKVTVLVEKDPAPTATLAATALYGIPRAHLRDVATYLAADRPPDNLGHLAEWWCARGELDAVLAKGSWIDIGNPDDLAEARRRLSVERAP